jgi:general secretion pathway protein D
MPQFKHSSMSPSAIRRLFMLLLAAALLCLNGPARAAPQQISASRGTLLNFKRAPIGSVVRMISKVTGKNFILDPRVQGDITMISTHPIPPQAVYATFLAMLAVHGYAAVPVGHGTYKIIPTLSSHQMPGRSIKFAPGVPGEEPITEVVRLRYTNAAQLVPVLRPLMSPAAQLSAYTPSNMLIISDRASNVARMLRIIHRVDRPSTLGISIIPLHYASATNTVRMLDSLYQGEQQNEAIPVRLVADPATNSILIAGSRSERAELRELITSLDHPVKNGGNTQVIRLRYARAKSLAKILSAYIKAVAREQPAGKGQAPTQQIRPVVVADDSINALVVTAPAKLMRSIRSIVAQLDVRRAQVLVQAIIAELTSNTAAQLGITWAALGAGAAGVTNFSGTGTGVVQLGEEYEGLTSGAFAGTSSTTGTTSASSPSPLASLNIPDGLLFGVGRIVKNGLSFAALLNALASNTNTNILSTPSLVALDNQKAKIEVGQRVPFLTGQYAYTSAASVGGAGVVNPFQTVERHEVGITLQIKPRISAGHSIILKIKQKVSSLAPSVQGAIDLITNNRKISTTVIANNHQIIVLGGLISDQISETKEKVPLLGDIPLLGYLFRYASTSKQKQDLMVFLQPTILRTREETGIRTAQAYRFLRALELRHQRPIPLMPRSHRPVLPPLKSSELQGAEPKAPQTTTTTRPGRIHAW